MAGTHLALHKRQRQEALMVAENGLPGEFGDALRDCREESGLSQQELAHEAAIPVRAIRSWERGRGHGPNLRELQSLAYALEMTPCDLIEAADLCDSEVDRT